MVRFIFIIFKYKRIFDTESIRRFLSLHYFEGSNPLSCFHRLCVCLWLLIYPTSTVDLYLH